MLLGGPGTGKTYTIDLISDKYNIEKCLFDINSKNCTLICATTAIPEKKIIKN